MTRIVLFLIVLCSAGPALSQARGQDPVAEVCGTVAPVAGATQDLRPSSAIAEPGAPWTLCPDCAATEGEAALSMRPAEGATALLFTSGGDRITPLATGPQDCRRFDLGTIPFIAPHVTADAEWTLEEARSKLEARYCAFGDEAGDLCLSFVCTPDEERWELLASGQVGTLDFTDVLEVELDARVDGALEGYLTLNARAGFEDRYLVVYVRQLDDGLLGALRRGQAGTFTVRAGDRTQEFGVTLDSSSRALGAVLGNCTDLQRLATPETAPDRFVLLNGLSTDTAKDAARTALDDRISSLLALQGAPDPDVRRAVEVRLADGWRFVDALVGPSPELGLSNYARYFIAKPPNRDWVVFDPIEDPPRIYIDLKRPIGAWPNLLLTTSERDRTIYERWYWDGENYLYRETIPGQ